MNTVTKFTYATIHIELNENMESDIMYEYRLIPLSMTTLRRKVKLLSS